MGNGIAQVFAMKGYDVNLIDIDQSFLDRALATIGKSFDRIIRKEIITEQDKTDALGRITAVTDLSVAKDSQLVIEAITEQLDVKLKVWKQLDEACGPIRFLPRIHRLCRSLNWPPLPAAPTSLSVCTS